MDINWWYDKPFVGRRDYFFPNKDKPQLLTFVRHDIWLHKIFKFNAQFLTNFAAWRYRKNFGKKE